jgi:hypothetical protein
MTQNRPIIKPIVAWYWLVAARAEFAKPDDWRTWADKLIISIDTPPYWIIAMSMALDVTELGKVLHDEALDKIDVRPDLMDDAIIGYIWWKFERQEFGLHRCLELIGPAADASSSRIQCEEIYARLNELEAGIRNEKDIEASVRKLLLPEYHMAKEQWTEIQSFISTAS